MANTMMSKALSTVIVLHYRKLTRLKYKPIFHRKLRWRWLPKANEMGTKHIKCTCPTRGPNAKGLALQWNIDYTTKLKQLIFLSYFCLLAVT